MGTRLVLRLTGENSGLGEVYASDVARLLEGADRIVSRTAAQIVGGASGASGRLPRSIARATRLRLTAISEGSLVLHLELADALADGGALDLDDEQLAESAIRTAIDVVAGSETGFPNVTAALSQLAEDLDIGERYEALALTHPGDVPHEAVLDSSARERLFAAALKRTRSADRGTLAGILYEADFERNAARLRTPYGASVGVRFDDRHAQHIKEALRESSELQGRITYDEATSAIVSVELTEIASTGQLLMPDVGDFWVKKSLEELAEAQGVKVFESIEMLQDDTISDEEAEAFIAALEL